jgi:hypothetical protein
VPLLLIICQELGNKVRGNAAHIQIFWQTPLNDSNGVYELTDFLAMVFVNEFSNFSTFSVVFVGACLP